MQKRFILWWMIFFLVACNLLVSLSMDIAIVSMNFLAGTEEPRKLSHHEDVKYNWSEKEQSVVLSGYYWLNYFSILPAGVLAQKYGPKKVMGFAQGISLIISFLIPILADYGFIAVTCIRAVQGFLSYMCVPVGIYGIIGNWSPPQERGNFISSIVVGASFGYAFTNFCGGYIAEHIHWAYIFYLTSICGIIWSMCWYIFVYDEPQKHPTITTEEKEYIESSLQKSTQLKETIPWRSIITSIPVIVCVFAVNSSAWYFVMLATYTPVYLKSMYGLSAQEIGIITSCPPLLTCVVVLIMGYVSDLLIKKGILSLKVTRRTWTVIGCIIAALPLIVIAFTKCNIDLAIICILLGFLLRACSTFGPCLGLIDLSPKFCGILDGISGTAGSVQTFLYASLITYFRGILSTEDFWKFVFIFTGSFVILTNLLYIMFGSWTVQPWNFDSGVVKKEKHATTST